MVQACIIVIIIVRCPGGITTTDVFETVLVRIVVKRAINNIICN